MRDFQRPGRSPVHALNAMAATSHPLATRTALGVLREGGNAMDAAIAACAVQCVVEPQSTGIGGDCFCIYSPGGSDRVLAYNGSGRAPGGAAREWYAERGIERIERLSPHAVTIPGAVDAWCRLLEDHGSWPLERVLADAVAYARDGYPVHARVAFDWAQETEALRSDAAATRIFLPGGTAPAAGTVHRQPELAGTLERLAREGRAAFYEGALAEEMVECLRARGGLHRLEDFATARGEYVDPIRTRFRGHEVIECPPNGQGIIALMILGVLERLERADGSGDPLSLARLHRWVEAVRLCYHDRDAYVADPAKSEVPVAAMLSAAHLGRLAGSIDPEHARTGLEPVPLPEHRDTVYLCVVDRDRNAVSFINTVYYSFGSCIVTPRSGIVLHNRGCGFVLDPTHPNCIAPGKRPLHTIIPAMLARDGRVVMPFGVMGGAYQAAGHSWLLSNLLDHGMDVQEAIDCPRLFPTAEGLSLEAGIPAERMAGLRALGHDPLPSGKPIGGAQAIRIDWRSGVLTGGSEPRKDGCALGY